MSRPRIWPRQNRPPGMGDALSLATVAVITGAISCSATRALIPVLSRRKILDYPNDRSSHAAPTPRGGGVAVIGAVLLAWLLLAHEDLAPEGVIRVSLGAGLLAVVCWIDDLYGLSPVLRLAAQAAAVAIGLAVLPLPQDSLLGWLWPPVQLAIIGLAWVWAVNLFNFMDGIDGIAGTEAASIGAGVLLFATFGAGADPALALLCA